LLPLIGEFAHRLRPFADAVAHAPDDDRSDMTRTYIIASALHPHAAARALAERVEQTDLVVTSPSALAREAATFALQGRFVYTVEEPLLAPRAPAESGADVLGRIARALRGVRAFDAEAPLVVIETLDVLGAGVFLLDEEGLLRAADALERMLPVG
jgi:hypothetical protein